MSEKNLIVTYSEDVDISSELQSAAYELSKHLDAYSIAVAINRSEEEVKRLAELTKDEVISASAKGVENITPEIAFNVLKRVLEGKKPRIMLIGSTRDGKDLAGMLASFFDCSVATDCLSVSLDSDKVVVQRAAFGGRVTVSASLLTGTAIIAVRPHVYNINSNRFNARISKIEIDDVPTRVKVERVEQKASVAADLTKSDRIVAIGRGLKRKEDLAIIQQLADVLSASVGCSRPLSSDLGWMPEETHIGLSGVQVKPKLYIAIGISGQLQHLAGMKDSGLVVAINIDKNAPIFDNCDYGIVGDLYQVVPELINSLKKVKKL